MIPDGQRFDADQLAQLLTCIKAAPSSDVPDIVQEKICNWGEVPTLVEVRQALSTAKLSTVARRVLNEIHDQVYLYELARRPD